MWPSTCAAQRKSLPDLPPLNQGGRHRTLTTAPLPAAVVVEVGSKLFGVLAPAKANVVRVSSDVPAQLADVAHIEVLVGPQTAVPLPQVLAEVL